MVSTLHSHRVPAITRNSLELLLDLVEIKLGCVEIYDREDARELRALQRARVEVSALLGRPALADAAPPPRIGRRPRAERACA